MAGRRTDRERRTGRGDRGERRLTSQRLDRLLNRLFTQPLGQEEAEAILSELAPVAGQLVLPLVNLLNSPDPHTREMASHALIQLRPPTAVGSVRALLDRPTTSDTARLAAFAILEGLGEAPDPERLLGSLHDPETLFERSMDDLLASLER